MLFETTGSTNRRSALKLMLAAPATLAIMGAASTAASTPAYAADSAGAAGNSSLLAALQNELAAAPRRRNFSTVPFLVDRPELWDKQASDALLAFSGRSLQVWEITELGAPWLNLMREAMNGQVFAHGNPDYLAVGAVHGMAHLALFNQDMWEKYALAENTSGQLDQNKLIAQKPGTSPADNHQDINGFYGPANNNISSLQRRGAVFVACHDSVHAIARGIASKKAGLGKNADEIAADLTNNLVPGTILVPSVVAYLVELQRAGFTYAKAD